MEQSRPRGSTSFPRDVSISFPLTCNLSSYSYSSPSVLLGPGKGRSLHEIIVAIIILPLVLVIRIIPIHPFITPLLLLFLPSLLLLRLGPALPFSSCPKLILTLSIASDFFFRPSTLSLTCRSASWSTCFSTFVLFSRFTIALSRDTTCTERQLLRTLKQTQLTSFDLFVRVKRYLTDCHIACFLTISLDP